MGLRCNFFQCRGGSAGCSAFIPDVVQCYNRGSDGLEIQWECKTEMPMEYKFGKVQVSCEGTFMKTSRFVPETTADWLNDFE